MENLLQCLYCFKSYDLNDNAPMTLTCGHSYCFTCIRDTKSHSNSLQCFRCDRIDNRDFQNMSKDFSLLQLLETNNKNQQKAQTQCQLCGQLITQQNEKSHKEQCIKNPQRNAPSNYSTYTSQQLNGQLSVKEPQGVCQYCYKNFKLNQIEEHEDGCSEKFQCTQCQDYFPITLIEEHLQACQKQAPKIVQCQICNQQFSESELKDHQVAHRYEEESKQSIQQNQSNASQSQQQRQNNKQSQKISLLSQIFGSKNSRTGTNLSNQRQQQAQSQQGQRSTQSRNQNPQPVAVSQNSSQIQINNTNQNNNRQAAPIRRQFELGEGMQNQQIDQLPTSIFNETLDKEKKCMVCIDQFKKGEEMRTLSCFHRFHKDCIDNWLARAPFCPICKAQQ